MSDKRLDKIEAALEQIQNLLQQVAFPATTLSVNEKASQIRKAMATGDKSIIKQTMRDINGE